MRDRRPRRSISTPTATARRCAISSGSPSSLDSMVVGEPQILGQLKEQYARGGGGRRRRAACCTAASTSRSRSPSGCAARPGIAEKAVSVGSAAVELARDIFDRLDDKTAMLIGAGKMGELAARQLLAKGTRHADGREPDLRARRRRGARARRHGGAVRARGPHAAPRRPGRGAAGGDVLLRPRADRRGHARAPRAADVPDRPRRAALLRSGGQRPRRRLPVRHRRPRRRDRGEPRRARERGGARRGHRRRRGRRVLALARGARRRADDRRAARQDRAHPPARGGAASRGAR